MSEQTFLLRNIPLFSGLNWKMLELIDHYFEESFCEQGEVIFRKGDVGSTLRVIVHGEVCLHDGFQEVASLGKREVMGEFELLTPDSHATSAIAKQDTLLLKMDRDLLYEIMSENVDMAKILIGNIVSKV